MKNRFIRFIFVLLILGIGVLGNASYVFGDNAPDVAWTNTEDYDVAHPGTTAPVMYIKIQRGDVINRLENIVINATGIQFGAGDDKIQVVALYKDDGDNTWDAGDTKLGEEIFSSDVASVTLPIVPRQDLDNPGDSVNFFIVYTFGGSIADSFTTTMTIANFEYASGTFGIDTTTLSDPSITDTTTVTIREANGPKIIAANTTDYDVAYPGTIVPVMYFTLMKGDANNYIDKIIITTGNGEVGYGVADNNIKNVLIYKDDGDGVWESGADTNITQSLQDMSLYGVTVNVLSQDLTSGGATVKLFIVYEYGSTIDPTNANTDTTGCQIQKIRWQTGPDIETDVIVLKGGAGDPSATSYTTVSINAPDGPKIVASNIGDFDEAFPGSKSAVFYFTLEKGTLVNNISQITITTGNGNVAFGTASNNVSNVFVYKDDGGTAGQWDATDTEIGKVGDGTPYSFVSVNEADIGISPMVVLDSVGEQQKLFFVYNFNKAVPTTATAGMLIDTIKWQSSPVKDDVPPVGVTATRSTIIDMLEPGGPQIVASNTGDFDEVYPGTDSAVFYLTLKKGDLQNDIDRITVSTGNGVVGFGTASNNIRAVLVYEDSDSNGAWTSSDTKLGENNFLSAGTVTVNISPIKVLDDTSDRLRFFIVYRMGSGVPTTNTGCLLEGIRWQTYPDKENFSVSSGTSENVTITILSTSPSKITNVFDKFYQLIPLGGLYPVYYIEIRNDDASLVTLENMRIENTGAVSFGGVSNNVKAVAIYRDVDGDKEMDVSVDMKIEDFDFNDTETSKILSFSNSITGNATVGYFIAYKFGTGVASGTTANVDIPTIKWGSNIADLYDPGITSMVVTASGVEVYSTANSVSYSFALAGDTAVPMLRVSIVPREENFRLKSLSVYNAAENFELISYDASANSSVENKGVVKAILWTHNATPERPTLDVGTATGLKILSNDETLVNEDNATFNSRSTVTFTDFAVDSTNYEINASATRNYFITYDIGVSTNIEETIGKTIKARLLSGTGIVGEGISSGFPISYYGDLPETTVLTNIAGLSYDSDQDKLKSIVDLDNLIGAGMNSPVFQFYIKAEQVAVSVNSVSVKNDGSIPFRTNSLDTDKVSKVYLYIDSNATADPTVINGYQGLPDDQLVASFNCGSGNSSDIVNFTLPTLLEVATNNSLAFYVTYDFGALVKETKDASGNVSSYASGILNNVYAYADRGRGTPPTRNLSLGGTLPAEPSPSAKVYIMDVNISVLAINEIAPTVTVKSQYKVPMLSVDITSDENVPSMTIVINNDKASFSSIHEGIYKVWIYRDEDNDNVIDGTDTFLGATNSFTDSGRTASVSGIAIKQGDHRLLIAYDIGAAFGPVVPADSFSAQMKTLSAASGNTAISVAGDMPLPRAPTYNTVHDELLTVTGITISTTNVTNNSSTFNISIGVRNNVSTNAIPVLLVTPRFYLNEDPFKDISYQFVVTNEDPTVYPATADANAQGDQVTSFNFIISPVNIKTEGTVYVDAFVEYLITANTDTDYAIPNNYYSTVPEAKAIINRYYGRGDTWNYTAPQVGTLTLNTNNIEGSEGVEAYVASVDVKVNGQWVEFKNESSVPSGAEMRITFANNGDCISESSIDMTLNGDKIVKEHEAFGVNSLLPKYTYNSALGVMIIDDVGTANGEILINVKDLSGVSYDPTDITFLISEDIEVNKFLFYPNPYSPVVLDKIIIGIDVTKPVKKVEVYIYDSTGREVARLSEDRNESVGYFDLEWDPPTLLSTGKYIASGIYIAKLVVTDVEGEKAMKVTKLAVF